MTRFIHQGPDFARFRLYRIVYFLRVSTDIQGFRVYDSFRGRVVSAPTASIRVAGRAVDCVIRARGARLFARRRVDACE